MLPNSIAPKQSIRASPALPSAVATTLLHLLCRAGVLLVGCCVIFIRRWPSKATTYFHCRFFSLLVCRSKRRDNTPPTHSALVAFPLQCPFHRRGQLLVGCCVPPSNGGHLRPRVLPSLYFFCWFISHPKWRATVLPTCSNPALPLQHTL